MIGDRLLGLAAHAQLPRPGELVEDDDLVPGVGQALALELGGVGERADVAEGGQLLPGLLVDLADVELVGVPAVLCR